MQKRIYILLMVVLKTASMNAQVSDIAFAAASYTFLYVADTSKPAEITSEKMVLYLGKHISAYRSYGMVLRDSEMVVQSSAMELQFQAGGPITFQGYKNKGSFEAVYKDPSQAKLYHIEKLQREYLLEEAMPVINWSILTEIKNIQGLSCQKATAHFRGRTYTAWFCSELPYDNGPWKLGGLPGLIVEASDDRNEVVFRFNGYEDVSSKKISIGPAKTTIKATAKEFKQLREAADADPGAFIINTARPGFKWITPPADPGRLIQKASKNPIERTPN